MSKKALSIVSVFLLLLLFFVRNTHIFQNLGSDTSKSGPSNLELRQIKDIPLTGGANRLDYQSIDYETNLLFISHLGSNMVHVFDLNQQQIIKDIPINSSPYGILAIPSLNKVFVGVGGSNEVAVIDENTLKVIKYIQAGDTPDGIAYDPNTKRVFVTNENGGTVTVIDGVKNEHIVDIPVGGSVGNTHYDPVSKNIYSVSGQDNTLVEIDPKSNKIVTKYPTINCSHPHGFYIDEVTHYALITCQNNDKIIVFDLDIKKIVFTDTVGSGADVLAFDPAFHRLYVAAESGVVAFFSIERNNVRKLGQSFFADKAHSISINTKTHEAYFPLENINGKPVLRIYKEK
ncbi:MAG TPA: YncE family protein [Candidatus Saccharimonadales bacterium]|nr:YncE family protein [Candidatus Saccharimonadales bacterium]